MAAATNTLRAVAADYLKREGKKLRSADQRAATLERLVYPALGARPIADIRRKDIVRLLDRIEDERGSRMADDVLAILRRLMNWHATRDDDFRSAIVRGMARTKPKERARQRILTDDELRAVWKTAEASDGPFGYLVRFLLLTATRRNESANMQRAELEGGDWIIPASRCKSKQDVVVPLSAAALALLEKIPRFGPDADRGFVFTTNGVNAISGFSKWKSDFDRRSGVTGWRLHDLRRSARSLLSRAGVDADIAERCLGHAIGGMRAVYDRYAYRDEKARAFEALAALIARIVNPPEGSVVPLRDKTKKVLA
jgi:integrase